jgi:hypothetical protein
MGTSLYDQYLKETGGPTKPPPAPLPAPPPIAAPDITRVAPRPAAPAPTEPLINRVARVNKAVRKALPLTGPLQQLEEGATKFGETTGYDLEAKRAQAGYAKAHPESQRAQQEQIVNTAMLALQFGTGGAGEALPAKRALSDVPFEAYSRLEHAVDKAPFEKGTAEQWKAALTPNVAAGERSWRGLDNLLEKKKGQVISRAELQGHLAENPIKVRASTYGGKEPLEYDEWRREAHNAGWSIRPASRYDGARGVTVKGFVIERPDGIGVDFSPTRGEAEEALVAEYSKARKPNRAKFQQYKEPGGEDYTERVLRLEHNPPPRPPTPEGYSVVTTRENSFTGQRDVKVLDPEGSVVTYRSGTRASDEDILNEAINSLERTKKPPAFKQPGHFPDENPIAHHRVTYHTVNGEKVAFVEEMQSDWHQKGRREGYRPREGDSYTVDKHPTDPNAFTILGPQGRPLTGTGTDLPLHYATIGDATEAVQTLQKHGSAVPDAPFKKTEEWTELALKDIIDQARANGATRVAWTTGEQQAARYDLSKHVDKITYNRNTSTLKAIQGDREVHSGQYDPRALEDVIGKEAAERLLASEPSAYGTHTLQGEGLKVGGEGMRAYYDRLVPKVVKEYAKKRGVKIDVEPVEIFGRKKGGKISWRPAGEEVPPGQGRYIPDENSGMLGVEADDVPGELRHNVFQQGHAVLDEWNAEDLTPPPPGSEQLDHEGLKEQMLKLQDMVDAGEATPAEALDRLPPPIRDQVMSVLEVRRVTEGAEEATGGFEGTNRDIGAVRNARRRALRSEGDDEESPIVMQLDDIIARMRRGEPFPQAASASLAQLTSDMGGDRGPANIVAQFLGGSYNPRAPGGVPNQSFSLKGIPEGPQPLWAVGAAGAGTALALQQGGDDKDKGGDLYKQFQAEQQKEGGDLYAQFKAEQPKPSVWDRLKSINAGVRQALVPDALQQLETGAAKFGKEQGEWGVQLAKDLKYVIDPARKAESGRPPTEETKAVDRRILFALATVAMPAGVRKIFEDWVIARGIRPPAPPSGGAPPVSPAVAERPTWDRSTTAPPPVDQPQPLRPEQQALRARLATEGITPAGAIRRRPPTAPPPVEPGPEAQTFSTKGAVRRPAAAAPPVEAATERRAEPRAPGDVWTPEQRAAYVLEQQRKFVQSTGNKLWSQWTPEEKAAYFADQDRVRAEIAAARAAVGPEEFQRRAIAAAAEVPGAQKMEAIAGAAHDIVAGETAHFPPEPKPGDLTPVVSSNSEFAARPGVMRAVNKGEQPASLNSPLRLPEPTPEDRAIVQPKGYKEISPEEVAARKPAPVVEATPKAPQPATVDENGLFFEHRTPGGELRDFRRVSTEGLIKAHREMQEQIIRDQQLAIYRNVEADVSGTQYGVNIQAATKTGRGTSQQAEAAERLRNYQKVMDRLDAELTNRGMSSEDVYNAIQRQEEHEGAIEQEAIHHADLEDEAGTAFDFGEEQEAGSASRTNREGTKQEPPISDVLNVAKLNLGSKTAEQRMAAKLEEFRTQREANKQTFAEADVNRAEILNELRAGDPIALPTEKAKKLSGEELLARRDLVRENDQIIQGLSKRLEEAATPQEHADAATLLEKAVAHNDALLSDLVTGSSQKGRDLNLLRRMAQQSLDPDVWRVQAKRMLGDRPLTAEVDAMIRKLLQEATDACG